MPPAVEVGYVDSRDGRRIDVSLVVDAPVERAWEVLTDTERWPLWGPTVSGVRSERRFIREGTTGEVQVLDGPWVPFEVTSCEDYRWTWEVARIPATGHRVESEPGQTCRVVFEVPLLGAGYVPVCRTALKRIRRELEVERAADEVPEE